MKRNHTLFTLFLLALATAGGTPLRASVTTYTDRSAFDAATNGLATIGFASAVPSGQLDQAYSTPDGLSIDGVSFVGNLGVGGEFLYAVSPAYFPAYSGWNGDPDILQGPSGAGGAYPGSTHVVLPAGTTAIGFGLYSFNEGADETAPGLFTIQLSTGDVTAVATDARPDVVFAGFTSTIPITSFDITGAPGDFPNLSNFSFGTVPEPGAALICATAALCVCSRGRRGVARIGRQPIPHRDARPRTGSVELEPRGAVFPATQSDHSDEELT